MTETTATDQSKEKKSASIKNIFSLVSPYIDPLDTAFSFGLCHLWRRRVAFSIEKGAKVLDICTGTGELAFRIARRVGEKGSVIGGDFCEEMLDFAKKKMTPEMKNISFLFSDATDLKFPDNSFDAVTVSFGIRNIPDTATALKEVKRVLRPGGKFLCLELTVPKKRWIMPVYKFYTFQIMPLIARIIIKSALPYTYLPRSIDAFYPPEEFKRLMEECGFSEVKIRPMSLGIVTLYEAIKSE